ncbi:MAG: HAMP domain-containing sensor histidine kinase [Eubacteriales bacterium]|nr:HAMP domain-containing sensor histidine kinase [Eubacteriales bacterium]MDD4475437.1 HAMP domain-containing sensor histidine kinase [Eubacteriales bacterium]
MYKSVFTRFISTFTLIIGFSFLILSLIISSMLTSYSIEAKKVLMSGAAENTMEIVSVFKDIYNEETFSEAIKRYSDRITDIMDKYANAAGAEIYITDTGGRVLLSTLEPVEVKFASFPKTVVESIVNGSDQYMLHDLGVFADKHLNDFTPITYDDNKQAGLIIVSSPSISDTSLTAKMTTVIISASLWVFLAAIIAVYIVSRQIVIPLRAISDAAKSFSIGKFDVRVPVLGRDEVAELATTFNNMAESLEHIEEKRTSLLANISHDLRTPMTTIAGFVDGIIDGTIPPEKQQHYLAIISSEVRRLSRLVSTLIELSKIEANEKVLNRKNYNLSEQARQIMISFEKKIDSKHIDIVFNNDENDVIVNADRDEIHQALYNLCDNAIKFTPEKGTITITIEKHDKKAFVSIRNTGEGIPQSELPFLFDRFYKSDRSRGLDKTGLGLGLAIVKNTLNRHGEDIKVNSVQGEFCEFTFTLPIGKPEPKQPSNT